MSLTKRLKEAGYKGPHPYADFVPPASPPSTSAPEVASPPPRAGLTTDAGGPIQWGDPGWTTVQRRRRNYEVGQSFMGFMRPELEGGEP